MPENMREAPSIEDVKDELDRLMEQGHAEVCDIGPDGKPIYRLTEAGERAADAEERLESIERRLAMVEAVVIKLLGRDAVDAGDSPLRTQ